MEYIEVAVQILGYIAALLGIYFASKPLAQNAIAILVTIAIVFSVVNSINSVKESEYSKHLSMQLMRSTEPADWFIKDVHVIISDIFTEGEDAKAVVSTTTFVDDISSITLYSTDHDSKPAALAGIAVLVRSDYQELSLLPTESLRKGVEDLLFETDRQVYDEVEVDRLVAAIQRLYPLPGESKPVKNFKHGVATNMEIKINDFNLKYDKEDLENLINCKPVERNLEFARRIAERHQELTSFFKNNGFILTESAPLCGLR